MENLKKAVTAEIKARYAVTPEDFKPNAEVHELREALAACENIIGRARMEGKLDNSGLSPVNDALIKARAALENCKELI